MEPDLPTYSKIWRHMWMLPKYILALSIFQWQQYIVKNNFLHDVLIKRRYILYLQNKGGNFQNVNVDILENSPLTLYVQYVPNFDQYIM